MGKIDYRAIYETNKDEWKALTREPQKYEALQNLDLNGVPLEVVCDVVAYCEANKTDTNDWVVLPIANFDCYYGNTNFSKKWLSKISDTILTREVSNGVSRVKANS